MRIAVVGAGLYGATVASLLANGNTVHVYEANDKVGGNIKSYYDEMCGCHVSEHGAHIFHTNSRVIWEFINQFSSFNSYRHYVKAITADDRVIDLPFGMSMFSQLLGLKYPDQARIYFESLKRGSSRSLEEWCINNVGEYLYETVVKNYTEKQWGRPCSELPADIIKRLPIRFTYDNTYFNNALFQGMPVLGYQHIIGRMLECATVFIRSRVGEKELEELHRLYDYVFFSGAVDELFSYSEGILQYRGLRFVNGYHDVVEVLGAPVVNDLTKAKHTRRIEHKFFYPENPKNSRSLVTTEFPEDWAPGKQPYYPIRDEKSKGLHGKYMDRLEKEFPRVIVGGRLGAFQYYDMDQVIGMAMSDVKKVKP